MPPDYKSGGAGDVQAWALEPVSGRLNRGRSLSLSRYCDDEVRGRSLSADDAGNLNYSAKR